MMSLSIGLVLVVFAAVTVDAEPAASLESSAAAAAKAWPRYRGPTGMGLTETTLPLEWGGKDDKNVLWKTPLPGALPDAKADHNQSSPIVWGDRVFVTMAFWPGTRSQK